MLDLKQASDQEVQDAVLQAFDALPPEGVLVVATAADPRSLIRSLTGSHWGAFDWAPLREGDGEWLFQLHKRAPGAQYGMLEMMETDHRRCDDLFAQAESAAQSGDQDGTQRLFGWLEVGMERHFRMEEEGFFSEVERAMGFQGGGPTAVMRDEHMQMRGILRRMAGAVAEGNLDDFLAGCETMLYLMEQHNMKEEQMLYPMAEDALGADLDSMLQRMVLL